MFFTAVKITKQFNFESALVNHHRYRRRQRNQTTTANQQTMCQSVIEILMTNASRGGVFEYKKGRGARGLAQGV